MTGEIEHDVDGVTFSFPSTWDVELYDRWPVFRGNLQQMRAKGVDVIAVHGDTTWLIEVKDYSHPEREPIPLGELPFEVAAKSLSTLGGLVAVAHDDSQIQQTFAKKALSKPRIRIVFHAEIPARGGALRNPNQVRANLRSKLKQAAKAVDPHAAVECISEPSANWRTRKTVQ